MPAQRAAAAASFQLCFCSLQKPVQAAVSKLFCKTELQDRIITAVRLWRSSGHWPPSVKHWLGCLTASISGHWPQRKSVVECVDVSVFVCCALCAALDTHYHCTWTLENGSKSREWPRQLELELERGSAGCEMNHNWRGHTAHNHKPTTVVGEEVMRS